MEGLKYMRREGSVIWKSVTLGNCHHPEEAGTSLIQLPQEPKFMFYPFKSPTASCFSWQHLGLHTGNTSPNFNGKEAWEMQFLGLWHKHYRGQEYAKVPENLNWWHNLIYYGENRSNLAGTTSCAYQKYINLCTYFFISVLPFLLQCIVITIHFRLTLPLLL